ncbi:NADPH2:quinone reductase [Herbihabitans rhizosphaerae]|uniref:enoyl-[acyl-carrier-protein] reductase n=1 Tax=Herbihabitans rhizosphaerae TaxID=1872711 RepID=A0A4Q7KM77_9PSEU|nr:zinc-dependent alcohol dehydrogenase family protein [Herbihabitans rhizosphaerae]RZS37779.1 NADPH2:quinone reductase [Herbihabitans rhizosphaerae]
MTTMRAVVAGRTGEPGDVLRVTEKAVPEPGPGEVLVRVHAAPIHASDLHMIRGRYPLRPEFPAVLGLECVGTVVAAGDGVAASRIGDRVVTVGVTGTWQEYVVAPVHQAVTIPAGIDDSAAAQLTVNPLTAWLLVTEELAMGDGEWLVQTAATSTVGRLVVQLANHVGFRTINVVRRRDAVDDIRALGGTEVICTADEDLPARLAALGGGELRKAIDCLAGDVGAEVFGALAAGGEQVVYGALSSHRQADPAALRFPVAAPDLIFGTKALRGFWLYRWLTTAAPDRIGKALGEVVGLTATGALTIPAGTPFGLDAAAEAARAAELPGHEKPLLTFG